MPFTDARTRLVPPGVVLALLVPAAHRHSVRVVVVPDNATAFSDTIGGGLLEEIAHGTYADRLYCMYGDEDRVAKQLPPNGRATALAIGLGWGNQVDRLGLLGDLLVVGAETPGRDTDVPRRILEAAERAGLL